MGKHVAIDELAGAMAHRPAIEMARGDAVVEYCHPDALYEQPLAVQRQIGVADVLEHADADHLVEALVLRQVAVIHQLQLYLILQPLGRHALAGQRQLLAAEGDAEHPGAELAGGEAGQSAPTAADIQQAVAGLEPQLAADQAQLGLLRLVDSLFAGLEIGTGIDHVAVQPELVEVVGQVIVVGDGLGIGRLVMGPRVPVSRNRPGSLPD